MHTAITEISPDAAAVLRVLGRSQWQRLYRVHLDTGPGLVSWRRSGR